MKYIVMQALNGDEHMFLFDDTLTHAEVSEALSSFRSAILKPVSAGSASVDDTGMPYCWGESLSLDLKCREDVDKELIQRTMRSY